MPWKERISASFFLIAALTVLLNVLSFACLDQIQAFLRVPKEVRGIMREYLAVIFCGIGCLFLLYGLYRALGRPGMSVALTVISLGTRVILAYTLSAVPSVGVVVIWWFVPVGWFLADVTGLAYYKFRKNRLVSFGENQPL